MQKDPLFRAWYKPDLERGTPILFEQVELDESLFFIEKDYKPEELPFKYSFETPFIDDDWLLEMAIPKKVDIKKRRIFQGDQVVLASAKFQWMGKIIKYDVIIENGTFFLYDKKSSEKLLVCFLTDDLKIVGTIHDVKKNQKFKK